MAKSRKSLTVNEAADYLGVHPGTLANWRCAGRGPRYQKIRFGNFHFVVYGERALRDFARKRLNDGR